VFDYYKLLKFALLQEFKLSANVYLERFDTCNVTWQHVCIKSDWSWLLSSK